MFSEVDPYNKEGALVVYHDSTARALNNAHVKQHKHYTVNDVKFDCNAATTRLLSTGNDKNLYAWDIQNSTYKNTDRG